MSIIPEVKCRRCGESFSALRTSCPNCGTRRVSQSSRTPDTTPGTVRGTAAYERANVNTRWQMIFGLILVFAVILAVVVMVSTGLDSTGTPAKTTKTTPSPALTESAPTVEPPPTPTPSPTPSVQTIEIRFAPEDRKVTDISMRVGEQLEFYAYVTPTTLPLGDVTWRAGEDGYVKFVQPSNGEPGHIIMEGVAPTQMGVNVYAELYGQEYKLLVRVNGG